METQASFILEDEFFIFLHIDILLIFFFILLHNLGHNVGL